MQRNPDSLLTRDAVPTALAEIGYPTSTASLATMATRGGGPPFRKFGRRVLYRWGDLLAWAEDRCSAPRCTTSEEDAA